MSESLVETPARAESIEIRIRLPKNTVEALAPFQQRAGRVSATAVIEKMIQRHIDATIVGCSLAPIPSRAYGNMLEVAKLARVPLAAVVGDCLNDRVEQLVTDPDWLAGALRKWLEDGTVEETHREAVEERLGKVKAIIGQRADANPLKHAFKL